MSKNKLFADAVAEAKEIRETAFSNAKLAMAESFAPQIKSMLSSQLNEMEEEDQEVSLDELLNELEGQEEVEGDETLETPEFEDETPGDESELGTEDDELVGEITVDELKDIIRDVQRELSGEEEFEPESETEEDVVEFEPEGEEDEELDMVAENLEEYGSGTVDPANNAAAGLDNLIAMIKKAYAKSPAIISRIKKELEAGGSAAGAAMRAEATELQEAKKVISSQSKLLKEMNLLNSKLLYVNKIFKAKNLTESQKVKVVNALDRCKDINETKNTFLTLKESLITQPTQNLRENRGGSSRPVGVAQQHPTQILKEEVDFVSRMQQLAGIKL